MKKSTAMIITSVAIASLLLTGSLLNNQGKPVDVKAARATRGDISSYLSTSGKVKSQTTEQYFGSPQLTVKKVNIQPGDAVKRGQTLIEFNTEDLSANLKSAQIQYNNAVLQKQEAVNQNQQIKSNIAKLDAQISALQKQDPSDEAQIQALKQRRDALQPVSNEKIQMLDNTVQTTKAALDSINRKYSDAQKGLVSEINGVVTQINANEGAVLTPSLPAAVVEDLQNLKVSILLGKYDAPKVKQGQPVMVSYAGKTYPGSISYISPTAADNATNLKTPQLSGADSSLNAEAVITDTAGDLKIGFDVDTNILIAKVDNAVKIPSEALRHDKTTGDYVMTVENNKAVQRNVSTGVHSDTEVQIVDGLKEGDTLILSPVETVKSGTLVRIPGGAK
ncbi:MAG: efflux RND transporter periplasmic adaptor subunit [Clostridia bacterium]|nr:efflux RND transporter periplasmic adaptor subunit [Clostridia bacterium]